MNALKNRPAFRTTESTEVSPHKGESVYRQLKIKILEGTLQPGQLISINRLAKNLGIGRSVVCESLARLKAEGFVRCEGAYARTYVEQRDLPTVVEHYEVRESIEGTAARLAAQNMNAWQVAELRRLADRTIEAGKDGSPALYAESNLAFHSYLVANCGNCLLSKIYETHQLGPVILRSHALAIHNNIEQEAQFFQHLCDAIASRDGETAESFLRSNLRQVTADLRMKATAG